MADTPVLVGIVAFLTARLDEDELLAREATPGPWAPDKPWGADIVSSALLGPVADCSVGTGYRPQSLEDARHIARWHPGRVLAEVAAKRRILARHKPMQPRDRPLAPPACDGCGWDRIDGYHVEDISECPELRDLAAPYAEHPDYDPAWSTDAAG